MVPVSIAVGGNYFSSARYSGLSHDLMAQSVVVDKAEYQMKVQETPHKVS